MDSFTRKVDLGQGRSVSVPAIRKIEFNPASDWSRRDEMIQRLRRTDQPCGVRASEMALAELQAITASRAKSGAESAASLAAYSMRLKDYPHDAVRALVEKCDWHFFPSWAEMKEFLDLWVQPRRKFLMEVEAVDPDRKEEKRPAPSKKQRESVRDLVASAGFLREASPRSVALADMSPEDRARYEKISRIMDQIEQAVKDGDKAGAAHLRAALGAIQGAPDGDGGTPAPDQPEEGGEATSAP